MLKSRILRGQAKSVARLSVRQVIKNYLNCHARGGGTQLFFGGCVPHGFPKVGSRERIFLEK